MNLSSVRPYLKYLVIGAIVGVLCVGGREVIALLLPADSPEYYALSVAVVYCFGILASYIGHRTVSFSHVDMEGQSTAGSMFTFTVIAIIGLLCTTVLAVAIRFLLPMDEMFGVFGGGLSFAIATLLSSIVTFILNARHTFR